MAIDIKKYDGSAWVNALAYKYTGSAWVHPNAYRWSGSAWIQIYPETPVTTTGSAGGSYSVTYTYRAEKYKNWKEEDAKQGSGSTYGGDPHNYGYLNVRSTGFTGDGNINEVTSAKYTGTRGGAGAYSTNQTVKFYRSNVQVLQSTVSTAASPVGTCTGMFTCTTGGPGSNGAMTNRAIASSTLDNCMDWMNGVGGKDRLYIASSSSSDYLSLTGVSKVTATYTYMSTVALFLNETSKAMSALAIDKSNLTESDIYHSMLLYPGEENMTLQEVMAHREANNLSDIPENEVNLDYIVKPALRNINVDNKKITVELDYLQHGHIPEFSIDGVNYTKMTSNQVDIYDGYFNDPDFNPYMYNIYVRVRNENTDTIDLSRVKEPSIILS